MRCGQFWNIFTNQLNWIYYKFDHPTKYNNNSLLSAVFRPSRKISGWILDSHFAYILLLMPVPRPMHNIGLIEVLEHFLFHPFYISRFISNRNKFIFIKSYILKTNGTRLYVYCICYWIFSFAVHCWHERHLNVFVLYAADKVYRLQ